MSDSPPTFTADIPRFYDEHLGPVLFEPYARDLAQRAAALRPRRVVEVASGTGILTKALSTALGDDVDLLATDLSASMLAHARAKLPGRRLRWLEADGADLPLSDASFGVLVCQFGYMFFPDTIAGFREAARVLRPDGTLLFNVWDSLGENPFGRLAQDAVDSFFDGNAPQFYHVPFGYFDEAQIRGDLSRAGFERVEIEPLSFVAEAISAADLATGAVRGVPVAHVLTERGKDAAAVEAEVARRFAAHGGAAPCRMELRAKVVTATRRKATP